MHEVQNFRQPLKWKMVRVSSGERDQAKGGTREVVLKIKTVGGRVPLLNLNFFYHSFKTSLYFKLNPNLRSNYHGPGFMAPVSWA